MDGATRDMSGVTDLYDRAMGASSVLGAPGVAPGLVWSNGGSVIAQGGMLLSPGAVIDARGGVPEGATLGHGPAGSVGGTLGTVDLVLVEAGQDRRRVV